ncbi:uncharacterized protein N7484_009677 [Penicillium longicatenatum]|uniref:uncharacterized protein n=1 Tax=Penicillium longicatenatum TaxID=1561947 RepID=UPI002546DB81|nr:uncharacterized protein N7484_009677 [Penicillium longicatenatum]KAJ5636364.1 hypothetical protein N7484_009677 [Penicillium longicatenatum]
MSSSSISHLFDHFRLPVDADNFTGLNGETYLLPYYLPQKPPFTQPLGSQVLILDADTRPLDEPGGILNETWEGLTSRWQSMSGHTYGRLNHYMWAKIHGYDYKLVTAEDYPHIHGTWCKVSVMREAIEHYKFVIFLDADIVLPHLHVPLEWLLNYWNINSETLIAMARDPAADINKDERGQVFLNTGFVIAQQSLRTKEMFEAWDNCLNGTRYPECHQWGDKWPHEQAAFGTYLRYDFNRTEDVKALPCAEANGSPEVADTGCLGKLVRHYWATKHLVPSKVQEGILRFFMPHLHDQFLQEYEKVEVKWGDRLGKHEE